MDANPGWTRAPWAGVPPLGACPPLHLGPPWGEGAFPHSAVTAEPGLRRQVDLTVPAGTVRLWLDGSGTPLLVLLHGAGDSGLAFAQTARSLLALRACRLAAFDSRGHGATRLAAETDLRVETLVADARAVVQALLSAAAAEDGRTPPLVLVGHSLGGVVATRLAAEDAFATLAGLAVLDVVEGSALAAMGAMRATLARRPLTFPSMAAAARWARRGESDAAFRAQLVASGDESVAWRCDLLATEPFWKGWFTGLSAAFLARPRLPKLLILTACDTLDGPLTTAQMQGRFQAVFLPGATHDLPTSAPVAVAAALHSFLHRLASAHCGTDTA